MVWVMSVLVQENAGGLQGEGGEEVRVSLPNPNQPEQARQWNVQLAQADAAAAAAPEAAAGGRGRSSRGQASKPAASAQTEADGKQGGGKQGRARSQVVEQTARAVATALAADDERVLAEMENGQNQMQVDAQGGDGAGTSAQGAGTKGASGQGGGKKKGGNGHSQQAGGVMVKEEPLEGARGVEGKVAANKRGKQGAAVEVEGKGGRKRRGAA